MSRPSWLAACAAASLSLSLCGPPAAWAQQDFFIPGQPKPGPAAAPRPAPRPQPRPAAPIQVAPQTPPVGVAPDDQSQTPNTAQMALPPAPELPPLPKGQVPPAAVIGVMGVPEVMRASSAAQQIEKQISERREKLNEDAQKEQAAWRDLQQALVNDRGKLSADQIRARERELQERITNAQRQFRERGRIIQDAAQYALAQIERSLVAVIRQVAESRGMNLVLHRAQVALNSNDFDITPQVAEQLNKITPTVVIPPDGVEPPSLAGAPAAPGQAPTTQVSAPPGAPATPK